MVQSPLFNAGVGALHQSVSSLQKDVYTVLERAVGQYFICQILSIDSDRFAPAEGSGQKSVQGNSTTYSPPTPPPKSRDDLNQAPPRRGTFARPSSTKASSSTSQSTASKSTSPPEQKIDEIPGETEEARKLRLFINKMRADINKNK